jgi:hypothetical protein
MSTYAQRATVTTRDWSLGSPKKIIIIIIIIIIKGRDGSVGLATRYELDAPGIESRWGARFSAPAMTGPESHPTSCTMGTGSFSGVKRPVLGVDHPPHLVPRLKKD